MGTKTLGEVAWPGDRGLQVIEFKDRYGAECSLQTSSAMGHIWLGCDHNQPPHHVTQEEMSPRMHLDRAQAKALIRHLRAWLNTGLLAFEPEPKE